MNILKKKEWDYAYIFYIVGFLTFISLINIVPIRSWMPNSIYEFFYMLFLGLGCVLIVHDFMTERCMFRSSLWWTLFLCVGIMVINTFFNRKGGSVVDDIKTTVWAAELVMICYSASVRLGKKHFSKVLEGALNIVVFIHSLAALVSVFQALLGIETSVIARGVTFSQGFLGRLYGVYMGPGESNSVICIALIIFFVGKWDKWYQKLYYIFCIGITYYSFLLENARACELAFLATSAGVAWIISRKYLYKTKGKGIVKEGIAIILTVLCVTSVYFINYGCRSLAYNTVGSLSEDQEDSEDQKVLNREIMQRDIRLDIWKAYITAFSKDRSLLGYNKSGYESYLKESYPECFSGVERFSTHSSYVDTLCRIGWVGFALLLLWIGYHMAGCLRYVIKRISLRKEEVGMIAVVIIMLTVGVFGEITFWTFTYTDVMIFWLIAGRLTLELRKMKQE